MFLEWVSFKLYLLIFSISVGLLVQSAPANIATTEQMEVQHPKDRVCAISLADLDAPKTSQNPQSCTSADTADLPTTNLVIGSSEIEFD